MPLDFAEHQSGERFIGDSTSEVAFVVQRANVFIVNFQENKLLDTKPAATSDFAVA